MSEPRSGLKLLDRVSRAARVRRFSPRTEEAYRGWVRRYVRYHGLRHPSEMGVEEINQFLTHLAVERGTSASTQAQARAALVFLYREVLRQDVDVDSGVVNGKQPSRLPDVLTRDETARVLGALHGTTRTVCGVLYGSGLRIKEALELRIKDLDLARGSVVVRGGKGRRDRVSVLPGALRGRLERQIAARTAMHEQDLVEGHGWAALPGRYHAKAPRAGFDLGWQYLFPATTITTDPMTGEKGRYHLHPSAVQRAVRGAAANLGMTKRVSCHTFRHCFATHLLESGYDIRTIQELLGHRSVKTTMIYTHVLNRGGMGVRSPLDTLTGHGAFPDEV